MSRGGVGRGEKRSKTRGDGWGMNVSTAVGYKANDKVKEQDETQEICNMRNKQRGKAVDADERDNLTRTKQKRMMNRLFQMRMSEWLLHSVRPKKNKTQPETTKKDV